MVLKEIVPKLSEYYRTQPRLTILGRSLLLLACELLVNVICWVIAGVLFGRRKSTQPILSLALLAWTIGLRHALDADHIRYSSWDHKHAIDNATRSLMSQGQLPVTCGLYFSLGHSTIVIVVNVAIAISTTVYDKIDGVGRVGGIVGAAVSGSFLFIVGLANSIILWRILAKRRRIKKERAKRIEQGEDPEEVDEELQEQSGHTGSTLMMKILGPVVTFVNRPWKMYPVGVLFGFGFDTASSIALLAVSAIAKKGTDGEQIPASYIVILPLLFTAGMTLVDSLDSILMLYSYAGFPERGWALIEKPQNIEDYKPPPIREPDPSQPDALRDLPSLESEAQTEAPYDHDPSILKHSTVRREVHGSGQNKPPTVAKDDPAPMVSIKSTDMTTKRDLRAKQNAMSGLSILLTLMSILVAFGISLITIMGLIGEHCAPCREAAEDPNGGGLAGRWWRGWANANDKSGYIGAAIVASFITVVAMWYGTRYIWRKYKARNVNA